MAVIATVGESVLHLPEQYFSSGTISYIFVSSRHKILRLYTGKIFGNNARFFLLKPADEVWFKRKNKQTNKRTNERTNEREQRD